MKIGAAGLKLIQAYEGFSPVVYLCPAGKPTIGYGHVVRPHEQEMYLHGISRVQAESLLNIDLDRACSSVIRLTRAPLSQNQFDALASFAFNLGGGNYQASTLRQKLNRGDYAGAAGEFRRWVFAGGRKLPGLINRRAAEAQLFISDGV